MVVIREPKNFDSDFHWPKIVAENLKKEIKFIKKKKKKKK